MFYYVEIINQVINTMGLSLDKLFTLFLEKAVIPKNQAQVRKFKNT